MSDPTQQALQTWDKVAPAWEQNRQRVFDGFRTTSEWLIDRIDPQPGQAVLELSAGPGETGFLAAERLGPEGKLISTDLSPTMVEAARRGAESRGLANVECRVMDAQEIDLPDTSVDGVISRLGLMLVPDVARVFAGVRRVLKPGGRLAYAVIGPPDRNQWMGVVMGALVSNGHQPMAGNPFDAGGPFSLADPARNRELLTGAGFSDVDVEAVDGHMPFDDVDDYWGIQSELGGPVAGLIRSLSAEQVATVRGTLEQMMSPFRGNKGYELPTSLVAVTAA